LYLFIAFELNIEIDISNTICRLQRALYSTSRIYILYNEPLLTKIISFI